MATLKSTQVTNLDKVPAEVLPTHEHYGRVRRSYFSFTVPVGNAAIADTIQLAKIRSGVRLYGGKISGEAMTSGGALATLEIGDGTTAAKYLAATSVDTAFDIEFGHTFALNMGEKLAGELTLTATVSVEAWLAGQQLNGYVDYVLD